MVRTMALAVATVLALLPSRPAQADFILGNAKTTGASAVPSPATPSLPDDAPDAPKPAVSRFKIAHGFGNAVPLAFAVRQIVPSRVRIRYGVGVDPEALVNWKGGRPWNLALAAAVRPIHLGIVTGTDTVLITR